MPNSIKIKLIHYRIPVHWWLLQMCSVEIALGPVAGICRNIHRPILLPDSRLGLIFRMRLRLGSSIRDSLIGEA